MILDDLNIQEVRHGATFLLVNQPHWRLMNRITATSRFDSVKQKRPTAQNPSPQADPEEQERIARDLADGWRRNGPWFNPQFKMVQFDLKGNLLQEVDL